MSKEDTIKCFLDCKGEDNGFQLTLTNEAIDVIVNEIERLKEENSLLKASEPMSKLAEDYGYKAEAERLNNIINKLEKWLEEKVNEFKSYDLYDNADTFDFALYKLQELKDSEKE